MTLFWQRHRVKLVLLAALLLRLALVGHGGQFFYADEKRFLYSTEMLESLYRGDVQGALYGLVSTPEGQPPEGHTGFVVVGLPAALVEGLKVYLMGRSFAGDVRGAALVLMLFAMGNLYLVHRIARRAGADEDEAFLALLFMSISNSMFYYAQHIFPYDAALFFILLALYISYRPNLRFRDAIWAGFWAACGVLTYYGYWMLAGVTLLVPLYLTWARQKGWRKVSTIGAGLVLGGILPLLLLVLVCMMAGYDFGAWVAEARRFSQTIEHGDPREGWSFVWEYLWVAESVLLIVWFIGVGLALRRLQTSENRATQRGLVWLLVLMTLYGLYTLFSTGLGVYVMYGRLVRVLVPFFCLLAAYGFVLLWRSFKPTYRMAVYAMLVVFAAVQFAPLLTMRYQAEFTEAAEKIYGDDISVFPVTPMSEPVPLEQTRYIIYGTLMALDMTVIYPPPDGVTVISAASPWDYLPNQYEGFSPESRVKLRTHDLTMRVIDTQPTTSP
jgi:hypothetical protein